MGQMKKLAETVNLKLHGHVELGKDVMELSTEECIALLGQLRRKSEIVDTINDTVDRMNSNKE